MTGADRLSCEADRITDEFTLVIIKKMKVCAGLVVLPLYNEIFSAIWHEKNILDIEGIIMQKNNVAIHNFSMKHLAR